MLLFAFGRFPCLSARRVLYPPSTAPLPARPSEALPARCPACHAREGTLLRTVGASEATQHYVLREVDPARHDALRAHIEGLWSGTTCRIVCCGACGLVHAIPFVAGDARFYTLAYERTGYRGWTWEYGRTRDQIAELVAGGAVHEPQVLEIGAGDGVFVRSIAPSLTPKEHVLCTEFSSYGAEAIRAYGIECLAADVREPALDAHRSRFDVACLFQVLEHLDRLDALFDRLNALTTPGAHLFVAVPNAQRVAFNEAHGSLLDMPPNHLSRWTRAGFEKLAERHGWRLVEHAVEPDSALARVKQHVAYRYVRRRQDARSLANHVERRAFGRWRRVLQGAVAGLYALGQLPTLLALARRTDLGDSQWAYLRRA